MDGADFMPSEAVLASVRQNIEAYEAQRAAALRKVRWRVPLFLLILFAVVFGVAWAFNKVADPYEQWLSTPHVFLYFAGFIGLFVAYYVGMKPADDLRQSFREKLLPIIFGFIQDVRYQHAVKPNSFDRLPRETVGSFNREFFDDIITGRYEGFPFELYEAKLRQKTGKSETTTFQGVVVAFEPVAPFPGVLVAARKAGAVTGFFRGVFGNRLEEIQSGMEALDKAYEFRTDNVDAARPLVTGRLAKALQWLGESWPSDPARVALNGSDGFLLLPQSKNFFELPGISKPLDYKADVEPMIADIAAILATASLVRKVGARDEAPPPA